MSLADRWAHVARGVTDPNERRRLRRAFYGGAAGLYNELSEVPLHSLEPEEPPVSDEQYEARLVALRAELTQFALDVKAGRA